MVLRVYQLSKKVIVVSFSFAWEVIWEDMGVDLHQDVLRPYLVTQGIVYAEVRTVGIAIAKTLVAMD